MYHTQSISIWYDMIIFMMGVFNSTYYNMHIDFDVNFNDIYEYLI